MSKHTEGPWEWADGTHALVGPKIDDKPVWLRPVVLRSETGVKAEDARLIAAAPALLEALQAYVLAVAVGGGSDKVAVMAAIRAADDKARAAIATATQEASHE
ncbi:MAG: hypothetical protein RJA63_3285 [Pseudomonadota bacterium]|jgi:hypothetical protein